MSHIYIYLETPWLYRAPGAHAINTALGAKKLA